MPLMKDTMRRGRLVPGSMVSRRKTFPGLGHAPAIVDMNGKPVGITCVYKKTLVFGTTTHAPVDKQIALARLVLQRM